MNATLVWLTALSLSIGWGIRGNFGHEIGALTPGALAAMAAVLVSGRADWHRRIAYFGFFGAVGWSFGGSISYMQVIAYTHSGHSGSVLYGFASLFLIGFLWAAVGGAGTALPAILDRERLTGFFAPLPAIFVAWLLQDAAVTAWSAVDPAFRHESALYWYDTPWLSVLTALLTVLALAVARRRWDTATALLVHMTVGWWVGFLGLVVLLGIRMTPPRGDSWSGSVGMVGGMLWFFWRRGMRELMFAALGAGFIGGFGFATATLFKLMEIKTGWHTNWHSVLEQTYGFINGLGIALAMGVLARKTPACQEEPGVRPWTEVAAAGFVLLGITYLNLSLNPEEWIRTKAFPPKLYGMPTGAWFDLAYLLLGLCMLGLLIRRNRRPLAILPATWLGKGQLLYLVFLWWMVVGNFDRAQVAFAPERLVTEGVIFLNAVICTWLVLSPPAPVKPAAGEGTVFSRALVRRTVLVGLTGMLLSLLLDWGLVRAVWGDQFAGYASKHIRFGPDATATKQKPKTGQPHP